MNTPYIRNRPQTQILFGNFYEYIHFFPSIYSPLSLHQYFYLLSTYINISTHHYHHTLSTFSISIYICFTVYINVSSTIACIPLQHLCIWTVLKLLQCKYVRFILHSTLFFRYVLNNYHHSLKRFNAFWKHYFQQHKTLNTISVICNITMHYSM